MVITGITSYINFCRFCADDAAMLVTLKLQRAPKRNQIHCTHSQCFLFQNQIKYFSETLIQKICYKILKIINCMVELTDVSAENEALLIHLACEVARWHPQLHGHQFSKLSRGSVSTNTRLRKNREKN